MWRVALALASLTLIGAAPEDEDPRSMVTIRVEQMGIVCIGICPAFKLDISDGWVMGLRGILLDIPAKPVGFRINHAQYLRFRERLTAVRPVDARDNAFKCETSDEGGSMLEIFWFRGQDETLRGVSCIGRENRKLDCAAKLALTEVGINPYTGGPIERPLTAQNLRDDMKESRGCE